MIKRFAYISAMALFVSIKAIAGTAQTLSITNFALEWYGLNGDMNGQPGSETRDVAIKNVIDGERLWADVMVFQEIVDLPRLQSKIVGSAYNCTSYDNPDPRHQHVAVCVRREFSFTQAPGDTDFVLEDVAMTHLRPAVHGIVKNQAGESVAHIVALHLKAQASATSTRLQQTQMVANYLATVDPSTPLVIIGDLNTFNDEAQRMATVYDQHHLNLVEAPNPSPYTLRTEQYSSKFDRVFIRGASPVADVRVAGPCNLDQSHIDEIRHYNETVSEHCPINIALHIGESSHPTHNSLEPFARQQTIPHFLSVTNQIYRGGRPTAADLASIHQTQNIQTVIDLEDKQDAIAQERQVAANLSMSFISSPMNARVRPTDEQVNEVLAKLQNASESPIFIHCFHGQDRTGLIVGIFRVEVQGWSAADAYQEMLRDGFHSDMTALDSYFRERTGYQGP